MSEDLERFVRFDDVYLVTLGDGHEPRPEWGTRDEACSFPSSSEAHEAKRLAKDYEGKRANIVVVKRRRPAPSPLPGKGEGGDRG